MTPTFLPLASGRLALWHRPGRRAVPRLIAAGCDRVVTLLSEREGARELGDCIAAAGLRWSWIPLPDARPPQGRRHDAACEALAAIRRALEAGESVLVHCSAGMHRTGMVGYALLRACGQAPAEALATLRRLRPHAHDGLTPPRREWAEAVVAELHRAREC
ncbi:MAG TPA: tyrosine-protein phosphatase [Thermoanaerobaculia bacterium]|nr:tyrosine-protein phosphatase [Thermoanaerobaculia bacterium]